MIKFVFLLSLFLASFILSHQDIHAFTFTSDSYIIDWGNFNITSGKKTSTSYNLTDTVGQNAPGQYNAPTGGYSLKSGFQYIYDTIYAFNFQINQLNVDFGSLVPQVGTTAVGTLNVSSPSGRGYQIMALENHPLQNIGGDTIPDLTGDNNLSTESISDTWNSPTTYGFGLNATGHGTSTYFSSANHYRQFANSSANESPQIIASEATPQKNRTQTITYKVNVSPIQSSGTYQNSITFIAVPKY